MSYETQSAWRELLPFLPEDYRLSDQALPTEEYWNWQGHQIHLDTYRKPDAVAKIVLCHGVGNNGRQMNLILGYKLHQAGYEVIAIDFPLFGETEVKKGAIVSYEDWINCGSDLLDLEQSRDDRPIILYGLSAGGMAAYHIAAKHQGVAGIIGMTFLDQRLPQVQVETTRNIFWGKLGLPLAKIGLALGLARFPMKMSIPSKMHALVNDPNCLKRLLKDKTSAGNTVSLKFLHSYMTYQPAIEPENFTVCPIRLTQPEKDRWTPQHLAELTLDKIKQVPVDKKILKNGSHFPIEAEALNDLYRYSLEFIEEQISK